MIQIYKAKKDHRHLFNKGDYVVLLNIEVVPTHNYLTKNAKKSIQVKVDIFDANRKKYNGFQHDLNTTDFKNLMDCLQKTELKKEDLYVDGS